MNVKSKNSETALFFSCIIFVVLFFVLFTRLVLFSEKTWQKIFFTFIGFCNAVYIKDLPWSKLYMGLLNEHTLPFLCTTKLNEEEMQFIEDAKTLIKSVDKSIVISDFSIYKVRFIISGWCSYNKETQKIKIFIPFKYLLKVGKNYCFMCVLHEILHSQNFKNGKFIFRNDFLEGLNQFFTIWLLNYSKKYEIPDEKCIKTFYSVRLTKKGFRIRKGFRGDIPYLKEVKIVEDILIKSKRRTQELFMKYIDFKPHFYERFVPLEYLEKQ